MPPKLSSIRHIQDPGKTQGGRTKDPHPAGPVKGKTTGGPKNLRRPGQGPGNGGSASMGEPDADD